jgi:hypothetical protein
MLRIFCQDRDLSWGEGSLENEGMADQPAVVGVVEVKDFGPQDQRRHNHRICRKLLSYTVPRGGPVPAICGGSGSTNSALRKPLVGRRPVRG